MKQHHMSNTPAHRSWEQMKQRCQDPNCKDYPWYGGRGIKVCDRWQQFVNFHADMGDRPEGMSLDRVDNEGDYEPGNCRWATKFEQKHNRSDNVNLTFAGKTQCLAVWARELGLHFETLRHRLLRGWSTERTLTTPVRR